MAFLFGLCFAFCVSFEFRLYPPITKEQPLYRKYYEIVPLDQDLPLESKFKVDIYSAPNSSFFLSSVVVPLNAPFAMLHNWLSAYRGHFWNESDDYYEEYIQISLLVEEQVVQQAEEDVYVPIYWDYRYWHLEWNSFEVVTGRPGQIWIDPIPTDEEFAKQTAIYWWSSRDPVTNAYRKERGNHHWVSNNKTLRWMFDKPRVVYFSLMGYNGYDTGHTTEGIGAYKYSPQYGDDNHPIIALRCCYDTGDCPPVEESFTGFVFDAPPIPGNFQFPIGKHSVTVLEETPLGLALFNNPQEIDIELPKGFGFADWYYSNIYHYEVEKQQNSNHTDCESFHLTRVSVYWIWGNGMFPLALTFPEDVVYGKAYQIFIKMGEMWGQYPEWQEVEIVPKQINRIDFEKSNKMLLLSDTWASLNYYRSLEDYLAIGFNVVPKSTAGSFSQYKDYGVEQRRNWTHSVKYGPEYSLIHASTNEDPPLYDMYSAIEMENVDLSYFDGLNLTQSEIDVETIKWQNAIDFFQLQGGVWPSAKPDPCYDGFVFQNF